MVAGIGLVVPCENSAHNIFVEFQAKCQVDLLGDSGAAVSWVAPFHLDNGVDDFFGGSFWAWLFPPPGEYSSRYFRFFRALWNDSRVEGLMIMAALCLDLL